MLHKVFHIGSELMDHAVILIKCATFKSNRYWIGAMVFHPCPALQGRATQVLKPADLPRGSTKAALVEPDDSVEVQVVGGLVQHQQRGFHEQRPRGWVAQGRVSGRKTLANPQKSLLSGA